MKINIGTRGSRLALIQAKLVETALKREFSDIETEKIIINTKGDKIRNKPLSEIGGGGLFVKEVEKALVSGKIDIAVHSAKDMPAELAEGLEIGAAMPRGDAHDVLVTGKNTKYPEIIGTGSLRRKIFAEKLYPECRVKDIRGNIDTRIKKMLDGEYDGIILALAGLQRLGANENISLKKFEYSEILPSACQGIIAVECRKGEFPEIMRRINDTETMYELETERFVLKILGSDCSLPVGALSEVNGSKIRLTVTVDCKRIITGEADIKDRFRLAERLVNEL
ncbi:MAG: hydroxymethylbilane synthase [Ruminococcus sp.]|nr:hydroxymethylbilane synthase [Ruminococcus sp.]